MFQTHPASSYPGQSQIHVRPTFRCVSICLFCSSCIVRAPTRSEMTETAKRVDPCFEYVGLIFKPVLSHKTFRRAGAMATGCRVSTHSGIEVWDLRQNKALGKAFQPLDATSG